MSNLLAIANTSGKAGPRVAARFAGIALVGMLALGAFGFVHSVNTPLRADGFAPAISAAATADPTPMAGTFTGVYENGLPVYRLPPVQITARRVTF